MNIPAIVILAVSLYLTWAYGCGLWNEIKRRRNVEFYEWGVWYYLCGVTLYFIGEVLP